MNYVAGFAWYKDHVWLKKSMNKGPATVRGLWNAIGGQIESDETPLQAIVREFEEEAGVRVEDWTLKVVLTRTNADSMVYFFSCELTSEWPQPFPRASRTRHPLGLFDPLDGGSLFMVPNLLWLIPLSRDRTVVFPVHIQDTV